MKRSGGVGNPPTLSNNPMTVNSLEKRLMLQYNIARVLAEASSIGNAASQVLDMICKTAGWEFGAFWRVDNDSHAIINEGVWHAHDTDLAEFAEMLHYSVLKDDETSLPAYALKTTSLLWISDLCDCHSSDAAEAKKAGLSAGIILPIRSSGKMIAILECLTTRAQPQDQNLINMLNAVSNQIGIFLERKILEETLALWAGQQHILAQAGIALSATLNYEERLQNFLHVIVPDMADWVAIDLIDQNNVLRREAALHTDPNKLALVFANQPTRAVEFKTPNQPQLQSFLSGKSFLFPEITAAMIEEMVHDPNQVEIIRQLDAKSCIIVPMLAHERVLGICTFVQSDSMRSFNSKDLPLAEDIGLRLALALDNAVLYTRSLETNTELEKRVYERTAQLNQALSQLTKQYIERQNAEELVRSLNSELEQRITERTIQLEETNNELQSQVSKHEKVSQDLRLLLERTRELYEISQAIGTIHHPNEVLSMLLSSSYLQDTSRASIAIFERPWLEDGPPPEKCFILAEWNRSAQRPKFLNQNLTLTEYGVLPPVPYGQPIVIPEIQTLNELPQKVRARFTDLNTKSLIILPLIANNEWYGMLSLHFSTSYSPNLDDLRHVGGLVYETAIAIQNTRLLEAESKARQEAEAANDLKLKFLAMISHELRTPLASIKGFATTLLSEDVVWPLEKQHDFLQTIDSESDKLGELIEQLLDLSRMEAGTLRVKIKKHTIQAICDSALAQLLAVSTGHELVMDIFTDLPMLYCDEQRVAQVLTNLVGNAAKYSPAQTQITVSAWQSGAMLQIDVSDQGIGIPRGQRSNVFEAFHQLENGSTAYMHGAGLGLAICKGLIEAQGGKIWIQDRAQAGTVVSFTLPVAFD